MTLKEEEEQTFHGGEAEQFLPSELRDMDQEQ